MSQVALHIAHLPDEALDAAAAFHREWLQCAREMIAGDIEALAIVLPEAAYDHTDWRRAAARDLARVAAPARVNIVAGNDERAIASTLAFLAAAPGVTGQYLRTEGAGAS